MVAAAFPMPIDLLSAQAWAELSERLEASGDLGQAAAAAENAVAVCAIHPYYGFPEFPGEEIAAIRKRIRPYYDRVIRLAEKRDDKLGLATARAQLVVLEDWIENE